MRLPHLAARIIGTPLLIAPEKLEIIMAVLGEGIGWPKSGLKPPPSNPVTNGRPPCSKSMLG